MDSSGDTCGEGQCRAITGTIKELRHKLGLTWEQFAARVGVSVTTVARWESGKHKPSPMAARRLKELEKRL